MKSKKQLMRMIRYKEALKRMRTLGVKRVYSTVLADILEVSPALVRKDFSVFKLMGNKKAGYNVSGILEKIDAHLKTTEEQNVVIAGYGKIGEALASHGGLEADGIRIAAIFDSDPSKLNQFDLTPVLPAEEMIPYIKEHDIKVGIIAVPSHAAQNVFDAMYFAGVRAVLNFAGADIIVSGDCVVHNMDIAAEIQSLFYFLDKKKNELKAPKESERE